MSQSAKLTRDSIRGLRLLTPGSELVEVPSDIADRFEEGDRLIVLPSGDILHIELAETQQVSESVALARAAFEQLALTPEDHVTRFYELFARALENAGIWDVIRRANDVDAAEARENGRSTTRLVVSEKMRQSMISGLREWRDFPSPVGKVLETTRHDGWSVDQVVSPLGVVAFVFEGRPNVFADATGVLRSGNSAVMRIGRDALRTATAIVDGALRPALREAGLPQNAVVLLRSRRHSAGWALFSDSRVALAVARGSGRAVEQLGSIARQSGIPISLHGAGGAWMVVNDDSDARRFSLAVFNSLDRKVCNTLNTVCLLRPTADTAARILLEALFRAGELDGRGFRLHVTPSARPYIPEFLFSTEIDVQRPAGKTREYTATEIAEDGLRLEWEWETTPELSLVVVEDLAEAAALFNRYSPLFVASLISEDPACHETFFNQTSAPFVGDGFTRWVDGQFALCRPELGLSNWQSGRLLGRSGVLSGDGIHSVRLRVHQSDPDVHR